MSIIFAHKNTSLNFSIFVGMHESFIALGWVFNICCNAWKFYCPWIGYVFVVMCEGCIALDYVTAETSFRDAKNCKFVHRW